MTPRVVLVVSLAILLGYLLARILLPGVGPVTPLYVP